VLGDVFVIGGAVHILSTASVTGDVIVYGGEVTIEGSVGGSVVGNIGSLRIDSTISGDVDVTVDLLTLGDKSIIEGDVRYTSNQLGIKAVNSVIGGEYMRNDPIRLTNAESGFAMKFVPLLLIAFSVLTWFFVSRRSISAMVEHVSRRPLRVAAVGMIALLTMPIVIGVLLISTLGALVAGVLLLGYFLFILLSIIALPAVLGNILMKVFNQPSAHLSLLAIGVGLVVFELLAMLPFVGAFLLWGIMVLAFGSIIDLLFSRSSSN
jgi:hypothetical protein